MSEESMLPKPGTLFGDYRIISEIGRGNNGVVYLAEQQPLEREVALKVLLPEHSADPEYIDLFLEEARAAARMCHPHIVQALDAGNVDGRYFLAMEYVCGRTMEDIRVNSPDLISFEFLVDMSIQLADALDYAWNNFKMTHGDVKPENLLICDRGKTLKLTDLGLARVNGRVDPENDTIMATPMYIAPEVAEGSSDGGVRGDIYSFGVMFYELIAGEPPFRGDTETIIRHHIETPAPSLAAADPDVPPELAEFTARLLAKSPDDRPQSWREVKEFLEAFRASRRPVEVTALPEPTGESPLPRILLASAAILLGLVLAVCIGLLVWLKTLGG